MHYGNIAEIYIYIIKKHPFLDFPIRISQRKRSAIDTCEKLSSDHWHLVFNPSICRHFIIGALGEGHHLFKGDPKNSSYSFLPDQFS